MRDHPDETDHTDERYPDKRPPRGQLLLGLSWKRASIVLTSRVVLKEDFHYTDCYGCLERGPPLYWLLRLSWKRASIVLTSRVVLKEGLHCTHYLDYLERGLPLYWLLGLSWKRASVVLTVRVVLKEGFHCTNITLDHIRRAVATASSGFHCEKWHHWKLIWNEISRWVSGNYLYGYPKRLQCRTYIFL